MQFDHPVTHIKLDIGLSYNAPHSQNWLEHEPNLGVIGFEPNPDCIEQILSEKEIVKKQSNHGQPISKKYINTRFILMPVALDHVNDPTEMTFYKMTNDVGTSSLYEPVDPSLGSIKQIIKVPVYSLEYFFDTFPWDRFPYIDYIKIDCQGADLNVIKSAGYYIKRVVYITAEPESNSYKNCQNNTASNMEKYLILNNFTKINHPNTIDPTFINNDFLHLKDKIYIKQF